MTFSTYHDAVKAIYENTKCDVINDNAFVWEPIDLINATAGEEPAEGVTYVVRNYQIERLDREGYVDRVECWIDWIA